MHNNGINAYRQTSVTTADPARLVTLCYEGAISNLKIAREKLVSKEYEAKAQAIQKVQDILSLLMQSLDFERGGTIADNLSSLYLYMMRRITEGDFNKDLKVFDEVTGMLEELESGWKKIGSHPRRDPASAPGPARGVEKGETEMTRIAGAY